MPNQAIDFQALFYRLPTPYMLLDADLRFVDMNEAYLAVTARQREDLIGRFVFDAFPEESQRRGKFEAAFRQALSGEANSLIREPFSIPVPDALGGGIREIWWNCHHIPVMNAVGSIVGMLQHAEDKTSEVLAEKMRDIIAQEFDHRIKNLLATVSAIARRTARSAQSPADFLSAFEARIAAMARTHDMLVKGGWDELSLRTLLESELQPFARDEYTLRLVGPHIELNGRQAQTLGMALHELATNAAKHGAFSKQEGRLVVEWTVDHEARSIVLAWRENGLTDVTKPERVGFGSTLIERILPMELGASVSRTFEPEGMHCIICLPLATKGALHPFSQPIGAVRHADSQHVVSS